MYFKNATIRLDEQKDDSFQAGKTLFMQFMERDEREQLKIMQDPNWKFKLLMEKL